MKVTLYMALSADGYIARADNSTPWSQEEWEAFHQATAQAGAVVVGRRTFEVMQAGGELPGLDIRQGVVVSRRGGLSDLPRSWTVQASPQAALKYLSEQACTQALVAGGSLLNAAFLQAQLIDEIVFDIEPLLFGQGLPLFASEALEQRLSLVSCRRIGRDTLQVRYRVERSK